MKLLVTGANGQLGSELKRLSGLYREHQFVFTDIPDLDLTDASSVKDFVRLHRPDVLVNAAAYTAVDKAESEEELAFKVNRDSVRTLVDVCNETGTFLIHTGTDYIFDGTGHRPYLETDPGSPVSVYGRSKYAGEAEVVKHCKQGMIIRTSWLYSVFGHNFVKTMLRIGKEKGEVRVVSDQVGSPTNARDLAQAIMAIAPQCSGIRELEVFHFVNSGVASWFDFASAIFEYAGIPCIVHPISTSEYPTAAKRPSYSVLNTSKIRDRFDLHILPWRESLKDCLLEINSANQH